MILDRIFGKKKGIEIDKSDAKSDVKSDFQKNYLSIKKDIEYLEGKYDDFIHKSLEIDYGDYKNYLDKSFPPLVSDVPNHWTITGFFYHRLELTKYRNNKSWDKLTIKCEFDFTNSAKFKLDKIEANINYKTVRLDVIKFDEMIFKYFSYYKLKELESENSKSKNDFQSLIDILGKDVRRDSIIDQILDKK